MNYLVFDWGGTFLKYALMNEETEILEQGKVPAPGPYDTKEEFYRRIDPIAENYRADVNGIAVSMPGMLDPANGTCRTAGSLRFLTGTETGSELSRRYGLPASVINDGKAAVLAEHWKGALKGCSDCAVIVIGTGIGGGIILNDQLLVGRGFSAGEYSYLCINETDTESFSGFWCSKGHRMLGERLSELTGENAAELDGVEVFRRVRAGDPPAMQVLNEMCHSLSVQIYNLSVLLNLEKIAIGGGISADPLLIETLQESLQEFMKRLPFSQGEPPQIAEVTLCRYGNDANLIGALYHHLYGKWECGIGWK